MQTASAGGLLQMASLSFLLSQLAPHQLHWHGMAQAFDADVLPYIFSSESLQLPARGLILLESSDLPMALDLASPSAILLVASAQDDPGSLDAAVHANCNVLLTDLTLKGLYRRTASALTSYRSFKDSLLSSILTSGRRQDLLDLAALSLDCDLLLFTPGGHLLASAGRPASCRLSDDARTFGFLDKDARMILSQIREQGGCLTVDGLFFYLQPARDTLLLAIREKKACPFDIPESLLLLSRELPLCRDLPAEDSLKAEGSDRLQGLICDFDNKLPVSDLECTDRLSSLPYPLRKYIRCLYITFAGGIPDGFLQALAQLFPGTNACRHQDAVILLYSSDQQTFTPPVEFESDAFLHLLEDSDARAILSNASSRIFHFRTFYELCRRLSPLLTTLQAPSRFCPYAEYASYLVIDFACQKFRTELGHDDIVTLMDPAIVALSRYDQKHNTDLRDVLYYYLRCGRSITKTAARLYMHRNTVQNKLNRIIGLIRLDLGDGRTQQRLLFSCQLLRYYEHYMNKKLEL